MKDKDYADKNCATCHGSGEMEVYHPHGSYTDSCNCVDRNKAKIHEKIHEKLEKAMIKKFNKKYPNVSLLRRDHEWVVSKEDVEEYLINKEAK